MKNIIIFGLLISGFLLAIAIFFWGSDKDRKSDSEKDEIRREELRQMVEKHLEDKYGDRFIVEEGWYGTAAANPLPFPKETGAPLYCVAYAESDLDFGFRVYVYPKTIEGKRDVNNVGKISDNYWAKFFRELIREELESRIDKVIFQDYKLVVFVGGEPPFSNEINQNSSIEAYMRFPQNTYSFSLNFITNENEELLKDKLYEILEEYDNRLNSNMNFDFTAYQTQSQEDFIAFHVEETEKVDFEGLRGHIKYSANDPGWWTGLEELFTIDDFERE